MPKKTGVKSGKRKSAGTSSATSPLEKALGESIFKNYCQGQNSLEERDSQGRTSLMRAIQSKDTGAIGTLIFHKADVNVRDYRGFTSLLHAAQECGGAIRRLITAKADVNATDNEGNSSLMLAVNNVGTACALLEVKADVNTRNNTGETALSLLLLTHPTLTRDMSTLFYRLLDAKVDLNVRNNRGFTPLTQMLVSQDFMAQLFDPNQNSSIQLLVGAKADIETKVTDAAGNTPLALCAANPDFKMTEYSRVVVLEETPTKAEEIPDDAIGIVERRIDKYDAYWRVNNQIFSHNCGNRTLSSEKAYNFTPILSSFGFSERIGFRATIFRALLEKSNIDSKNNNGDTPASLAAKTGHKDSLHALVHAKANIESPNNEGYTALSHAALRGSAPFVKMLVDVGANIAAPCKFDGADGVTPIILAAWKGDTDSVRILILAKANTQLKDSRGRSALDMAVSQRHPGPIKLLRAEEAKLAAIQDTKKSSGDETVVRQMALQITQLQLQFNAAQLLLQQQNTVLQRVISTATVLHRMVQQNDIVEIKADIQNLLGDIKTQLITMKDEQQRGLQQLSTGQKSMQQNLNQMKDTGDETRELVQQGIVDNAQYARDAAAAHKAGWINTALVTTAGQRASATLPAGVASAAAATAGAVTGFTPSYGTG